MAPKPAPSVCVLYQAPVRLRWAATNVHASSAGNNRLLDRRQAAEALRLEDAIDGVPVLVGQEAGDDERRRVEGESRWIGGDAMALSHHAGTLGPAGDLGAHGRGGASLGMDASLRAPSWRF